ncbi:sugar nucleotide-binding protein [Candidatus Woesearchaeota archaeon]|nr:sugar nucleotide-binding protein [Candidatus Woesearchaeota archaeon]
MGGNSVVRILLTGGSGTLGRHILKSGLFKNVTAPSHHQMDVTKQESVEMFFAENDFDAVIHCAALARVSECEQQPEKAIAANATGTCNLAAAVIKKERKRNKSIRFVHISTDAVYECTKGNYNEGDATIPYNKYGWTKLCAEAAVNLLTNFCIIRTRFFDPENIKYDSYATDTHSSQIQASELVKAIATLLENGFVGVINVGGEKVSDYDAYKRLKPSIKPCKLKDIQAKVSFKLPEDATLDTTLWKKIEKRHREKA